MKNSLPFPNPKETLEGVVDRVETQSFLDYGPCLWYHYGNPHIKFTLFVRDTGTPVEGPDEWVPDPGIPSPFRPDRGRPEPVYPSPVITLLSGALG